MLGASGTLATVSIIVPFRDKMHMTNDCLATLAQSLEPAELACIDLILVNNRSTEAELATLVVPPGFKHRRLDLDIDFNFQTLNNRAAAVAEGNFLILLNNDIIFMPESKGWLPKMVATAARPDVGAVGPLLYYPDMTIQHGGVVVGMYTYAEHLYRGWTSAQANAYPFTAYNKDRYVSAVTAAFLMVERKKFEQIRGMDERFIVCGGDVDLCVRLDEVGYKNVYKGTLPFLHLESKSRAGSPIPQIDFVESRRSYDLFLNRHGGRDPYYPLPLSLEPQAPVVGTPAHAAPQVQTHKQRLKHELKRLRRFLREVRTRMQTEPLELIIAGKLVKLRKRFLSSSLVTGTTKPIDSSWYRIPLMATMKTHAEFPLDERPRLNIILPHYNDHGVFAGIITATTVGAKVALRHPDVDLRFIMADDVGKMDALRRDLRSTLGAEAADSVQMTSVEMYDRSNSSLSIHKNDHFMATAWWTCFQARDILGARPFLYLVQDFECGFYPWSDWYSNCLATYGMDFIPVFNTSILRDFFLTRGLISKAQIDRGTYFEPAVSKSLYSVPRRQKKPGEKRRVFFYGREGIARNLFPIGIAAMADAIEHGVFDPNEWEFVSAGQSHQPIHLAKGAVLRSVGKMSLTEYAKFLSETEIGLSLMLSPHPSYPPLEIAAAGALCVTNTFENKDLSALSPNIISCAPSIEGTAAGLRQAAERLKIEALDAPRPLALPDNWHEALDPVADKIYAELKA